MSVATILVMWPNCREETFVPPTQGVSTFGPVVSEEKMFEIVDDGRTPAWWVY